MIYGITGHRPPRLKLSWDEADFRFLVEFMKAQMKHLEDAESFVSGGALGTDQAFAVAAMELEKPLIISLPFENMGTIWPQNSQDRLAALRAYACEEYIAPLNKSRNACYLDRDRWTVDKSNTMLALFDSDASGGTYYTIEYAQARGVPVINLWETYLTAKENR